MCAPYKRERREYSRNNHHKTSAGLSFGVAIEEASGMGSSPRCDSEQAHLKKGPWTEEEDQRLIAYIKDHGIGSWRSLPKLAGLRRNGKSCRLRWTNYLCPDLKRGRFTSRKTSSSSSSTRSSGTSIRLITEENCGLSEN